jgi:hypothetical protein
MSVNSVNALGSQPNTTQFVQQIVSEIDGNHDGQITSAELGAFLTTLLSAVSSTANGSNASQTADRTASGTATDAAPSTWTGNNAPYGVTLAGFSPQNHTNLTATDLANPLNAKYAAYNYLLTNQVTPNSTWATDAATALNQKYGTTTFHAIDGETLGYGDEYIHSAQNGYGMAAGTYDPGASGEFFWGFA